MALGVNSISERETGRIPDREALSRPLYEGRLAVAVFAAFWPAWSWYLRDIVDRAEDPWSLLPLIAAGLFYGPGLLRDAAQASRHRITVALGIVALYIATYAFAPHIVHLGLALAALSAFSLGARGRVPNLGGLALLVMSLPLFPTLQFYLGFPLRVVSAHLALPWLHGMGFGVELRGMDFVAGGMVVSVDAPCSGIQMLWSAMFLAAVLIAQASLPFRHATAVFAVAMGVVLLGNALRMASLFCLEMIPQFESDATHAGVGLMIFAAGCAAIVAAVTLAKRKAEPCNG